MSNESTDDFASATLAEAQNLERQARDLAKRAKAAWALARTSCAHPDVVAMHKGRDEFLVCRTCGLGLLAAYRARVVLGIGYEPRERVALRDLPHRALYYSVEDWRAACNEATTD